jgi:hypothetical protein
LNYIHNNQNSGPRRYEFNDSDITTTLVLEQWTFTRDGTTLISTLRNELLEATGVDIYERKK